MSSEGDPHMLLMAILPMTLIVTILVTTALDRRGYLGSSKRLIGLATPLAVIAASLALGLAALYFARFGQVLDQDRGLSLYSVAVGVFYVTWAQLHLMGRATWTALVGAIGTAVAIVGSMFLRTVAATGLSQLDVFTTAFELGLILVLVPAIAPALVALLAKREMPVQRAVVLGAFGVVVVTMFTTIALVGGG